MTGQTLISPYGYDTSTCGYCTASGSRSARATSKKYAFEGSEMTVNFYQSIIDRGWRRSGDFVYHPDIARSCCPQYTIRLDAREYKPNKKHRQVLNRWNRYLSTGSREVDPSDVKASKAAQSGKGKQKAENAEQGWCADLHRYEVGPGAEGAIRMETELTPATATTETFELYKRYQISVHQDKPEKVTRRGFSRFLCESPLIETPIQYSVDSDKEGLPEKYGSYHLLYKVNGKIIGISVIDILPTCVSSVYFIWDPDWAWASLGKISAMYEASLARRIWAAGGGGGYVYMGYWIANCQKMRYKSDYSPSFLLDPSTHNFHPLTSTLDKYLQAHPAGYHPFADITEESISGINETSMTSAAKRLNNDDDKDQGEDEEEEIVKLGSFPSPPPPGFTSPSDIPNSVIGRVLVLYASTPEGDEIVQIQELRFRNTEKVLQSIKELYAALGPDLIRIAGQNRGNSEDKGLLTFH